MKKRMISVLAVLCMVFSLVGCGSSGASSTPAASSGAANSAQTQEETLPNFGNTFLTMLTGSTGGSYYPIGIIFSTLWNEHLSTTGLNVSAQSSAGGVENLNMLRSGEADLGLAVSDFGYYAMTGTGTFDGQESFPELRGICGLWPELVHLVVTEDSGIESIEDVIGHRVSVGGAGSGTAYNTPIIMDVLANAEIDKDWTPEYLAYSEASVAMQNGQVDGINITGGIPVSSVTELMAGNIGTKIISFTQEQCDQLNSLGYSQFGLYTIPANTYNNQPEDITTLGYKCELFTTADMDEELVYHMTKTLFENMDEIRSSHKALSTIEAETCLQGLAEVPLHPGAVRYFQEIGVEIPEALIP